MKKKIVILGSTGSIGKSTIKVIKKDKKEFDIKFDPEDIMELEDVGDMIAAIEEYTNV